MGTTPKQMIANGRAPEGWDEGAGHMTEKGRATTLLILVVLIIIAAVGLVAANNRAAGHRAVSSSTPS